MAFSNRNLLGNGGAQKESILEAAAPPIDKALYGAQLLGAQDGRFFEIDSKELILCLGENWIYTEVGASASEVVAVPTATLPPRVIFTTAAGANDRCELQYASALTAGSTTRAAFAGFIPRANLVMHAQMRFRVTTTVATCGILFGLAVVDTTLFNAGAIGYTEGLMMKKLRTVSVMSGDMRVGGTSTVTTLSPAATVVVNTWHTIGIRLNGTSSVSYYFDGAATGETTMTNIPTAALCPSFAFDGNGSAATIEISGVYFGQEVV